MLTTKRSMVLGLFLAGAWLGCAAGDSGNGETADDSTAAGAAGAASGGSAGGAGKATAGTAGATQAGQAGAAGLAGAAGNAGSPPAGGGAGASGTGGTAGASGTGGAAGMAGAGQGGAAGGQSGAAGAGGSPTGIVPTTCEEAHGEKGCCFGNTVYFFSGGQVKSVVCKTGESCGWLAGGGVYGCTVKAPMSDPDGNYPITCGGAPIAAACP